MPPTQVEIAPHLHQPSRSSASASAEDVSHPHRLLPSARPMAADVRTKSLSADVSSADVSYDGTERETQPARRWQLWRHLAKFAHRFPPKRFMLHGAPNLSALFRHVSICAVDADLRGCGEEEWATLVFSSAVIKAARVALGRSSSDPMAHFLQVLEHGARRELAEGSRCNLEDLKKFLLYDLQVELEDVGLSAAESTLHLEAEPEPSTPPDPRRSADPPPRPPAPPVAPRPASPAAAVAPAPLGTDGDCQRTIALEAVYRSLSERDRRYLDERAEAKARMQLGEAASAPRVGSLMGQLRLRLVEELYPERIRASA